MSWSPLDANEVVKAVGVYWQDAELAHQTQRELARYLIDRLSGRGSDMYEIETRTVEEQRIASIEERVLAPELPDLIARAMTAVFEELDAQGVQNGVPFVVYHGEVNLDADGPVEVCVPAQGAVEPTGSMRVRLEPAHTEAFTRITKAQVVFPKILDAYAAVDSWITEQGHEIAGSSREVYFTDFSQAGPDDEACDIAVPYTTA